MRPLRALLARLRKPRQRHCSLCGRKLYAIKAVARGMGSTCARKAGAALEAERAGQLRLFE